MRQLITALPFSRGQLVGAKILEPRARGGPKYQAGTARTLTGSMTEQAEELIRNNMGSQGHKHDIQELPPGRLKPIPGGRHRQGHQPTS